MNRDEYKNIIIEMIKKINNEDYLMKIYYFIKVKFDKENR